jgi:hypothetical protein
MATVAAPSSSPRLAWRARVSGVRYGVRRSPWMRFAQLMHSLVMRSLFTHIRTPDDFPFEPLGLPTGARLTWGTAAYLDGICRRDHSPPETCVVISSVAPSLCVVKPYRLLPGVGHAP